METVLRATDADRYTGLAAESLVRSTHRRLTETAIAPNSPPAATRPPGLHHSRRCPCITYSYACTRRPLSSSLARRSTPCTFPLLFLAVFVTPTFLCPLVFSPHTIANAATCVSTAEQKISVSSSTANLSSLFDCEGGSFDVIWSGTVEVAESIRIGYGTTVSVLGDYENGYNASDVGSGGEVNKTTNGSAVVASGELNFGPIFVLNGSVLFLEGIAIRDGNASSGGGMYAEDANVTIVGCEFEDNFAQNSGGAISAIRSRLVVLDTVFRRCTAGIVPEPGEEDPTGKGGGVDVESTDTFVSGCLFENCYAGRQGGGLHQNNDGSLSVVTSMFLNNSAGVDSDDSYEVIGEAGALSLDMCTQGFGKVGACGVNDSTFANNHVPDKAGAVILSSDDTGSPYVEFHRCLMVNNSAGRYVMYDERGEGGAFSVAQRTTLVLVDTIVQGNYAGKKGGAITVIGGDSYQNPGGTVVLRNSTFDNNMAEEGNGGAMSCNDWSTVHILGDGSKFTRNYCGAVGGVLAASANTSVTIEGGEFYGNEADEYGGVFWTKGSVAITGGLFSGNKASDRGGVFTTSEYGFVTVYNGTFHRNHVEDEGGVGFITKNSALLVSGGSFSGNLADGNGGVFNVEPEADLVITAGRFTNNKADFGGFLYIEGTGSCAGASITNHQALDGGAIYALDGAVLDWACDLGMNDALAGPAIYARQGTSVTLRGVVLYNNQVARGSVVFVVSSTLRTYQVSFTDRTESSELSAVQIDDNSTYEAEYTSFNGFVGEAVVYSEGALILDECDFSGSVADVLVFADGPNATTIMRNAVLGDDNYADPMEAASSVNEIPTADTFTNVEIKCEDNVVEDEGSSSSLCSEGSLCLEGDLGVYCQCYKNESASEEACINRKSDHGLILTVLEAPPTTFYPNLLEGDLNLSLPAAYADDEVSGSDKVSNSVAGGGGVVWNTSAVSSEGLHWTVFPSSGLLYPGQSVKLRVVSLPSMLFDRTGTVTFRADAMGFTSNQELSSETSMNVTFYQCTAGNFWNSSTPSLDGDTSCKLCTDTALGDIEGLHCSSAGVSTNTLPLSAGYWRASLSCVTVRKCFNTDACVGGSIVQDEDEYCASGYEGPYCAVCSSGYGRGLANECHRCTTSFKGGAYFVLAMAALFTLVVAALLALYLVDGERSVTSTVGNAWESARGLRRRASSLLVTTSNSPAPSTKHPAATIDPSGGGEDSMPSGTARHLSRSGKSKHISRGRSTDGIMSARGLQSVSNASFHFGAVVMAGAGVSCPNPPEPEDAPRRRPSGLVERGGGESVHSSINGVVLLVGDDDNDDIISSNGNRSCVSWGEKQEDDDRCSAQQSGTNGEPTRSLDEADAATEVQNVQDDVPSRDAQHSARDREAERRQKEKAGQRGQKKKQDTVTARTGTLVSVIPLSKLKIVIVVWQILSAFSEVTQVDLPPIYEKFVSVIGLFTFDLGWMFSAACIATGINFYDKLLMVTIGPAVLLCLLAVTFNLGMRRPASAGDRGRDWRFPSSSGVSAFNRKSPSRISDVEFSMSSSTPDDASDRPQTDVGSTAAENRADDGRNPSMSAATLAHAPTFAPAVDRSASADGTDQRKGRARTLRQGQSWKSFRDAVQAARPAGHADPVQGRVWRLFARHTTMTLIILYLVYTQVSTVIFQTFACQELPEVHEKYLRADFRIECGTPEHQRYKIYARIMILLYPLGIPAAFCYFLARQRSSINPPVDKTRKHLGRELYMRDKIERRQNNQLVAPTSFLWNAYYPDRYYYEVFECGRRLLLTGLLVFVAADTPGQVAFSCVFAFLSLLAFELLRPHVDFKDMQLYRTGCLVIFFSNFLALMIKAEVANPDSNACTLYSVVLVGVNILLFVSIWWNTWATVGAFFSRRHIQGAVLGFDAVGEDKLNTVFDRIVSRNIREEDCSLDEEAAIKTAGPSWDTQAPPSEQNAPAPSAGPRDSETSSVAG